MPATTTLDRHIELLRDLLASYALKKAPEGGPLFELASGQQSDIYFDVKNVTLAPEGFDAVGKAFWEIAKTYEATAVGGLATGAIPIAVAVAGYEARQGRNDIRAFFVRDEKKAHGTRESIYQSFDTSRPQGILAPDSRLLLVDDVLTSGKSIGQAMDELLSRGASVAAIAVLVDRVAGGAKNLREKYGLPVIAIFQMDDRGNLTYHGDEVH